MGNCQSELEGWGDWGDLRLPLQQLPDVAALLHDAGIRRQELCTRRGAQGLQTPLSLVGERRKRLGGREKQERTVLPRKMQRRRQAWRFGAGGGFDSPDIFNRRDPINAKTLQTIGVSRETFGGGGI